MVSPLLDNYLNNISDAIDISNLSILITNFYRSFLNYEVLHNQTKNYIIGHYNPNKKMKILKLMMMIYLIKKNVQNMDILFLF